MSWSARGVLVYLAHPRTASIATERAFAAAFPRRSKKTKNHHAQLHEIDYRTGKELVVTTIRNPLDMIVSWYFNNPSHQVRGLEWFILNYKHSMMERNGKLFYFVEDAGFVMKYEQLQQDFNEVMRLVDGPRVKIPITNVTKNKNKYFMEYHTPQTIQLMWDRWPEAMKIYE